MSGSGGVTAIVDERFCFEEETQLTVHNTSVFFPGDGFLVYDPKGELIFRFDSYGPDFQPKDELVLMEASGKCLLTLLRKGRKEKIKSQFSVFADRPSSDGRAWWYMCLVNQVRSTRSWVLSRNDVVQFTTPSLESPSKEAVAKIKRKVDPASNVTLGRDVFLLCLKPGFDGAFTMGLVLILGQMYGDDDDEDVQEVDPTPRDSSSS